MFSFRRCVLGIGVALCTCAMAIATPALTTIQDVLYKADGTPYQGSASISWHSFEAVDNSTVAAHTITVQIVAGFFRVRLVPTTNAVSPASYTVVYNSGGSAQFTESWLVPPSDVPVRIRDVRIGAAGTTVGGGSTPPGQLTSVQISDVIGLSSALSVRPTVGPGYTFSRAAVINSFGSIDGASGVLTDCLHVDGSSAPCGSGGDGSGATPIFIDGEIPLGTINGANGIFTLANTPVPPSSLALFRNGMRLRLSADYTLSNTTIAFSAPNIPVAGDNLLASYRLNVTISGVGFIDSEIPGGAVDGVNTTFTVAQAPNPSASLQLYRNGLRMRLNLDYTNSGTSVVFGAGLAPQPSDVLLCSYRVAQ